MHSWWASEKKIRFKSGNAASHKCWSVTWVCFSQSDSSSDNGGLCTVQYRLVQSVQQPHPCQLIQAPSSRCLTRPQYLWMTQSLHRTWPLYCADTVQLYSTVRGLPAGRSTLYRQRLLLWLHTHTLLISFLGPVLSFQIKTLIVTLCCVYHLVAIFQIVVQCPGLCCSWIPFIDPGQHSRAPGCRSQSCSVSTRPLVRHHNTICDQWHERDKHQPSHPFLLFNPKIPIISSELSLIDFLYEKIFCPQSRWWTSRQWLGSFLISVRIVFRWSVAAGLCAPLCLLTTEPLIRCELTCRGRQGRPRGPSWP